jgi:hypothetical protein
MDRLITPDMFNRAGKAGQEITEFINMLKDDHTTFDHLGNGYLPILKRYYPIADKVVDIRDVGYGLKDVELPSCIITMCKEKEDDNVNTDVRYRVVNDIALSRSAEVEVEPGYMEMLDVVQTIKEEFIVTFN